MLIAGFVGAFMTAAYMTRCIYLTFHGEPRGAAAEHHPHESGPRILWPIYILTGGAVLAGFVNFPFGPDAIKLRFEHYVEPVAAYFPAIEHPEFTFWIAALSTLVVAPLGIALAYAYWWRGMFHGVTERNRVARAGYAFLENKYYFDHIYVKGIAGAVSSPIAKAIYWINQNVIDGIVNGVAAGSRQAAHVVYDRIDQQVVDGAVDGAGAGAEGSGQLLRRLQTGKVQQYGTYLFGGAVLLAAFLIVTT